MKLANDLVFNEDNKDLFRSGYELFALAAEGPEVCFSQMGLPAVFLDRPNSSLLPLTPCYDLASEFSHAEQSLPPLPSKLIGVDGHSDFQMQSLRLQKGESLILVSRSFLPNDFFTLQYGSRNLEKISEILSKDNEGLPFWIGILTYD